MTLSSCHLDPGPRRPLEAGRAGRPGPAPRCARRANPSRWQEARAPPGHQDAKASWCSIVARKAEITLIRNEEVSTLPAIATATWRSDRLGRQHRVVKVRRSE